MILAAALALCLQEPQEFKASADRLTEKLQFITTTIKEWREKKRVHAEALAEVEAYMGTFTKQGVDLQAKAKELEDLHRTFAEKKKEYDSTERDFESENALYKEQLKSFNSRLDDINRRWDANEQAIKQHNARQDQVTTDADREAYRQNAARLTQIQTGIRGESDRLENTDRPSLNQAREKVIRKEADFQKVQDVYFDLDSATRREDSAFRRSIVSMEGPAEALRSLLQEAGKKSTAAAFRVFATRSEAVAGTLAEAFGSGVDLPDTLFARTLVIRRARERATTRDYIVEKLRLGELIESLRALSPGSLAKPVAADQAFDTSALTAIAAKPCSLVKAAWKMKAPEAAAVKPQAAPALREP
jgi:hypothetical protein